MQEPNAFRDQDFQDNASAGEVDRDPSSGQRKSATVDPTDDLVAARQLVEACQAIRHQVAQVVVGQDDVIEQLLIAILARGHCLLEGVPGLAKTLMVRTLAQSMHLDFRRIQFTPDLMPADITGTDIIQEDPETNRRQLVFQPGPVFTQMLLADEINRTPPKTQAALLEAMQEHEVTASGHTYRLKEPFFVLATQNPIEQEGTYPLPEAQRDRFLFHVLVNYPNRQEEAEIIDRTTSTSDLKVRAVVSGDDMVRFQSLVRRVPLPQHVRDWVLEMVCSARPSDPSSPAWVREFVQWGPGPRASQQLVLAAKARCLLHSRSVVSVEDVQALAHPILRHRMVPTFAAEADGIRVDDLIDRLMDETKQADQSAL
ncbi:AAA family ATPase [Crateriforma conspicua]|uniref:Holliday junction DNA helicase RuvB n=1 Tax=Crateriforma conspicua TaxID=2527996 RepID=A0A5C5Y1V0_9PLAN|nr:MoxR family ATPase [Crateriforma conspicua]QDV64185.1 Holliday junction DNA helicase RuvB [Crateriforma conspicua]TWT69577.1 Holliday junction DNA helicase RuvB [Crateriforma conspicua]